MIPLSYFTVIGFRKPFGDISSLSIPFSVRKASAVFVWTKEDTSSSGLRYLIPYISESDGDGKSELDVAVSVNTFGT